MSRSRNTDPRRTTGCPKGKRHCQWCHEEDYGKNDMDQEAIDEIESWLTGCAEPMRMLYSCQCEECQSKER